MIGLQLMDDNFRNFVLDNYLWQKFEHGINNISENEIQDYQIETFSSSSELKLLLKIYEKTKHNLSKSCKLYDRGELQDIKKIDFHFKYGWILRSCDAVAFLGKITKSMEAKIEIGNFSYLSGRSRVIGHGTISIGPFTSIGEGCNFYTSYHDHPYTFPSNFNFQTNSRFRDEGYSFTTGFDPSDETKGDIITIGADCWLGSNVTVKNAANIGLGAVVGQNSFVANELENYGIYAGSPAKLLKYRFSDHSIAKLMRSRWWDWGVEDIRKHRSFFAGKKITDTESS